MNVMRSWQIAKKSRRGDSYVPLEGSPCRLVGNFGLLAGTLDSLAFMVQLLFIHTATYISKGLEITNPFENCDLLVLVKSKRPRPGLQTIPCSGGSSTVRSRPNIQTHLAGLKTPSPEGNRSARAYDQNRWLFNERPLADASAASEATSQRPRNPQSSDTFSASPSKACSIRRTSRRTPMDLAWYLT